MGFHSPLPSYRQPSSDSSSELVSPTLSSYSSYSSRRSSEKLKFQGYPSPYSSSPPEPMTSSSSSSSSSSYSFLAHSSTMFKHGEPTSQTPCASAHPSEAYQSQSHSLQDTHSPHGAPQQQAARPQLPPISSLFSSVTFSRPELGPLGNPPSPLDQKQSRPPQHHPHPSPYYQPRSSHSSISINTAIPHSNGGRPTSSHVSPMSMTAPESYRYDAPGNTTSGRSYSSASSVGKPEYLLSRESPPQVRHQQMQNHTHNRLPLQYTAEPRHSISTASVSSQTSISAPASSSATQPAPIESGTTSPAPNDNGAAATSSTKDGLGPKIWTGTHFLPRFVKAAQVPGEGLCYFYDDGTHCKTVIDGEAVNAHWGVTKAGKPRKRLAIACVTCREKKIKCDPDYPRCVQCEKFGRVCRFKNAPRGGHNIAASSQLSVEDNSSRRMTPFLRPSTEVSSLSPSAPEPLSAPPSGYQGMRSHIQASPRRAASPEPLSPHKRMRTSYDAYAHPYSNLPPPPPAPIPHGSMGHMQRHDSWQPPRDMSRDLPRLHESVMSAAPSWHRRDPYVAAP
ncbi:hypothetical protein BROUX41_005673 [Berkeleyomyces rouxiae]|uniref:uncharacterized protein n=1 Tax=Berkeleyomyces rouxiae TaxID=2035830 RepID=UPI003B7B7971